MTDYAEIDALLQDALDDDDAVSKLAAGRVHDFETQLRRPLTDDEVGQLTAQVENEFAEANAHADRVAANFSADIDEQIPRVEFEIGRKLLRHEVEGVLAHTAHVLATRGEQADANAALLAYWEHRTANTGEEPPDMDRRDQAARYMADRLRDMNAAAAPEPTPENPIEWEQGGFAAHQRNTDRMTARALELAGEAVPAHLKQYATAQETEAA